MSSPLSNGLRLSSTLNMITEEAMVTKNQGIVSILGSDSDTTETRPNTKLAASSLRRTLSSADMSSKKGLISPLKKIESSHQFPVSIIEEKKPEQQFDIWNSILSSKKGEDDQDNCSNSVIPYIHPLVRISANTLSEKSLAICTESLGSETGADDGFPSYPRLETGSDIEEDNSKVEDKQKQQQQQKQEIRVSCFDHVNVNGVRKFSAQYRSFPPPIPSLSLKDGASVRMETHRDNGRLVVEAVSVTSQNNFLAQRQDGRLVLTFANTIDAPAETESEVNEAIMNVGEEVEEVEIEEFDDTCGEEENSDEEEAMGEDRCCEMERGPIPKLSSGAIMNVHRLAVMMNKPIWLANTNPASNKPIWLANTNPTSSCVKIGEEMEEPTSPPPLAQSLPARPPRVARLIQSSSPSTSAAGGGGGGSFNAYEYYWRRPNHHQPMSKATIINSFAQLSQPPPPHFKNINSNKPLILSRNIMASDEHQQQLLVLRGNKGDYFVPLLERCKETRRRSLLFWEPCYCIATSS